MSLAAVVTMTFALIVVWGGLVASALFLRARPEIAADPADADDAA